MENVNRDDISEFMNRNFAIIYYFIFSIGLLNIVRMISITVVNVTPIKHLSPWVINFFNPNKPQDLTEYIVSICVVGTYFGILFLLLRYKTILQCISNITRSNNKVIGFVVYAIIANIVLSGNPRQGLQNYLPRMVVWLILFILPFILHNKLQKLSSYMSYIYNNVKIQFAIFALVVINFIIIIYPFVFGKLKIINEFWDIPEQTIINGKAIDNTKYINDHGLIGINGKFDIIDAGYSRSTATCIHMPFDKSLENLIKCENDSNKLKKNYLYYYYDEKNNSLCVNGKINTDDKIFLENICKNKNDEISRLYFQYDAFANGNVAKTKEEKDFISKNEYEINWQILNRFWLHHHNHIIGPMNEINLGKKIDNIYMQYGWMDTIILKSILNYVSNINYQDYNSVLYAFYYVYYALFIGLMFLVLKKTQLVLPCTALLVAGLNKLSYPFLYIAPGVNPIRHCFDVAVMFFFYLYIFTKKNTAKKIFLLLSLLFSVLGILNSNEIGLFLFVSLIFVLLIKIIFDWKDKSIFEIIMIIFALPIGLYFQLYFHMGTGLIGDYFKKGLMGFNLPTSKMMLLLVIITLFYSILVKQFNNDNSFKYICLLLFMYSQCLLLYFIWGSDLNHFIVFSPIFAFTVMSFVKLVLDNKPYYKQKKACIATTILLVSLILYIPSIVKFYKNKSEFNNIFKSHVTYKWDLPTCKFISTMNPKYFTDSIDLINKYSYSNGIYIISKYDNFIPFISGKYSSMPYFDMPWYLMSNKEVEDCINVIRREKPKFIFVDTDINRAYESDIIDHNSAFGKLFNESVWRVQRLNQLKTVFNSVKYDYVPVKSAYLLTVYERKI